VFNNCQGSVTRVGLIFKVHLHDNNVLKTKNVFPLLYSWTDGNVVKAIPGCTDPQKQLKMLDYSCQDSSWQCQRNYAPIDWTSNMHTHGVTVFTHSGFCSLHGGDNGIFFKNLPSIVTFFISFLIYSPCVLCFASDHYLMCLDCVLPLYSAMPWWLCFSLKGSFLFAFVLLFSLNKITLSDWVLASSLYTRNLTNSILWSKWLLYKCHIKHFLEVIKLLFLLCKG